MNDGSYQGVERNELAVSHRKPGYTPSRWMRLLLGMGPGLQLGAVTVVMPDGAVHRFRGKQPGPDAVLVVHDDRMARRFIVGGTLGFCESYLDGDWTSPDVPALFELALRNEEALEKVLYGHGWFRAVSWVFHKLKPNTRKGSRRNIAYHYDLGNDFYRLWLDETMTYSSAVYAAEGETLAEAQRRKYAEMCRRMDLKPEHHVLEIGCGWGGFAEYAAGTVGARVTAITISQEQFAFATERMKRAGLSDKVEIRLQDYRDLKGQFDRIASIEMFEAVGEKYWPVYFETVRERLKPGGKATLQIITIADQFYDRYRTSADYIQKYIFPGGMLPSPTALRREVERAGLAWQGSDGFALDYARTLDEWQKRFQAAWPAIQAMGFDARFKRMWEQYLWYCEAGFKTGCIDVVQATVARE